MEAEERKSQALKFTYPLDMYLKDEDENLIDEAEYTVTFSDGTKKRGKFRYGPAKTEDAPYGRFTIEVEGYDSIFE